MSKNYYFLISAAAICAAIIGCILLLKAVGINLISSSEILTQNAFVQSFAADLSAEISAPIKRVLARDFAKVSEGELLFELDCSKAELAGRRASVQRDLALSRVRSAELAERQNTPTCAAQSYAATAALARKNSTASELERVSNLRAAEAASQKLLEAAREAAASAFAQHQAALANLNACELKGKQLANEITLARLEVDAAEVALAEAGRDISRCKIYAPFSGSLGEIKAGVGDLASPARALARLVGQKRWIQANIKENDLLGLNVGDLAEFDASGRVYEAIVERISAASGNELSALKVDNSVGNFIKITQRVPVVLRFKNPDAAAFLAVGQSGKLRIFKGEKEREKEGEISASRGEKEREKEGEK